jgi:uncharacterized protein (TIGR03083 family)
MRALHADSLGTAVIADRTNGVVEIGSITDLGTSVPSCRDWSLADLVWHLAEVQHFWAWTIAHRPAGPDQYGRPERPADDSLADLLADCCARLVGALDAADPDEPAWSWSDDHTVGFTVRRQSHESLIHFVDAVLAAGAPVPDIDAFLAADGVDELLGVMLAGVPEWADFASDGSTASIEAADTGDRWLLGFGRMTGTSPDSGTAYDLDAVELLTVGADGDATIRGSAVDLDLWLWGRADGSVLDVEGDDAFADRLRTMVAESTR